MFMFITLAFNITVIHTSHICDMELFNDYPLSINLEKQAIHLFFFLLLSYPNIITCSFSIVLFCDKFLKSFISDLLKPFHENWKFVEGSI